MDELAELSIASRFLPIPLLQMITSILASITFVEVYSLRINSNNVVNIIESLYICKFKDYSRLVKAIITHQWDTEYKLLFLLPIAIEAPYPDEAANDARMFLSEHLDELLKIFNHIIYSRGEKDVNRLFALIITIDNLVLHDHDFTRLLLKSPSVPPDIEKYLSINYLLSECDDLMAFENAVDFLEKIFMLKESILKTVGAEHDGGFLNMLNSTDPKEINDFFGMYRTVCFTAGSDIDRERIAFNIAISNIAELYQDQAFVLLLPYVMKTLLGSSPKACINTFKKYIDHNDEIMKLPNVLAVTMMEYSRIQPDTLMLYPVYKDILYQSKLTCGFHLQVAFIQSDYFDMIQPFEENEIAELFLKVLDGSFFLKESIVEVSLEVLKKLESYENIAKTFELMLKKLTKLYEANQLIIKLNRICHETSNHNNVMRTFDLIANIIKLLLFKNNDTVLDESVFSNQDWFEEADIDYIDCFQNLYAYNPTDQTGDPGMKLNLLYCQMVMAMATNKNNSLERLSKTYGEATIIRVNINNIRWLMDLYKRQFSPDSSTYSLIENSFKQLYYYC